MKGTPGEGHPLKEGFRYLWSLVGFEINMIILIRPV